MASVKYYYDSETLSYRKIEVSKAKRFRQFLFFILASASFGIVGLLLILNFVESPKEKRLMRELDNMKLQYSLLNKKMQQAETVLAKIEERDNSIYRAYFEANPISEEIRQSGFGGVNRYQKLEGYNNSELIIDSYRRVEVLQKRLAIQSQSLDEVLELSLEKEKLLEAIPAIQPVSNEDLTRMASGYGWRTDPFTKARKFHYGMDFTAPRGTPVYATG
ncbi:MAG: M23 family peptidase, partial [Flavobacteriaceae bacterium]|nr:M23 family peptidase [Flavobacteriaceae bacterium]